MWTLYRIAAAILSPFWLLALGLSQGRRFRPAQRLGFLPRQDQNPVWIQAVSLGEARIALRLGAALRSLGLPVFFTATTAAGMGALEGEGGTSCAFPLDLPSAARRALDRLRPRALLLVETELWPVLIREARRRGIPVLVVNGRLSDRALGRCLRFKSLYRRVLEGVFVGAQTEEHAARFRLLGAFPERVTVLGNLKYDLVPPPGFDGAKKALEELAAGGGALWVAGSVREGEEGAVAEAHASLRASFPGVRLVLAPRHLDRTAVAEEACRRRGLKAVRRTAAAPGEGWDVLLLDTLGELWAAYGLGEAAFVGGSLVALGGQNVLEPAYLGKPVLFGPHTENFREDAERLLAAGGGFRVDSPAALAWRLESLLRDPDLCRAAGRKARAAVEEHRGAVERAARWVAAIVPGI